MTVRYDAPPKHLAQRLDAYAMQAKLDAGARMPRPLAYGTLASIVPLVASVSDARAQDPGCFPPLQSVIELSSLNSTENWILATQAGTDAVGTLRFYQSGTTAILAFQRVLGAYPLYATTDPPFALRSEASDSFSFTALPGGFTLDTVFLCAQNPASFGAFCPGSGNGFLPVVTGGGVGYLELEVLFMSSDSAAVALGFVELEEGSSEAHAGDCSITLPVELVSFDVRLAHGEPVLQWETASELNNAGFEVQRASVDGRFQRIGFIEGHGTSDESHAYRFTDDSAQPNAPYRYRLKQIDFDGTPSFSQVVELFTEMPDELLVSEVYPNPTDRGARLDVNLPEPDNGTIEIYDVRGALVHSESRVLNRGQNQIQLEPSGLAAGSHFVKIQIGERVLYRQFAVTR